MTSRPALLVAATALACCSRSTPSAGPAGPNACASATPAGLSACVQQERYVNDLSFVAQERPPGSSHWKAVQQLCAARLQEYGYQVELHSYGTGVNVIGRRAGTLPAELIVSAHYEHIAGCVGADDNASGVAALLETARVLASANLHKTLVVACWDEEERGLIGSRAYAARARSRGEPVEVVVVYETMGYASSERDSQKLPPGFELLFPGPVGILQQREFRGDFVAAVGNPGARAFMTRLQQHAADRVPMLALELPADPGQQQAVGDLFRSDHASFWQHGIAAVMLTDTADFRNPNYHCQGGPDTPDTLDPAFGTSVVRATVAAIADWLTGR